MTQRHASDVNVDFKQLMMAVAVDSYAETNPL